MVLPKEIQNTIRKREADQPKGNKRLLSSEFKCILFTWILIYQNDRSSQDVVLILFSINLNISGILESKGNGKPELTSLI